MQLHLCLPLHLVRPLSAIAILKHGVSVCLLDDTLLGYYLRIDVDHHWVVCAGSETCLSCYTGTFLYVAFMEVIPRELAVPSHRSAKLGMLMLGFVTMSILAIWA